MTGRYDESPSGPRTGLSRDLLARLISVYGANPRRWPMDVGKLELGDVGMNPELRAELAAEAALDEALDSVAVVEIPDRLRGRLLNQFDRFTNESNARVSRRMARLIASLRELVWPGAPWWQPACALSLSVLVGLSAGLVIPASLSDSGDQQVTNISDTPTSVDVEQGQ